MPSHDELLVGAGLPRLESRALLEAASGKTREWLIAHGDEPAPPDCEARFVKLAQDRRDGVPIAYLTGNREFFGRPFRITPAVLIPRIDTELLAEWAIAAAPDGASVLDLGTGSGALAITLALERPDLQILATDLSPGALALARENATRLGATVRFEGGDWWAAVPPRMQFDLIVCNPPYVARSDPHCRTGDPRFEPPEALIAGEDGLDAFRCILDGIAGRLNGGGRIAFEHGFDQAERVARLLEAAGLADGFSLRDSGGHWRVSGASSRR